MLKLYRVARTEAQPGTRGYTAPTRVPISCHSCHGHYLHIIIAGSVKDNNNNNNNLIIIIIIIIQ